MFVNNSTIKKDFVGNSIQGRTEKLKGGGAKIRGRGEHRGQYAIFPKFIAKSPKRGGRRTIAPHPLCTSMIA